MIEIKQRARELTAQATQMESKRNGNFTWGSIIAADTFDAMANDRPYRKAVGAKKAINTEEQGRNKPYDPRV